MGPWHGEPAVPWSNDQRSKWRRSADQVAHERSAASIAEAHAPAFAIGGAITNSGPIRADGGDTISGDQVAAAAMPLLETCSSKSSRRPLDWARNAAAIRRRRHAARLPGMSPVQALSFRPARPIRPRAAGTTRLLGRRQVVRHRFLVPTFPGSTPGAPAKLGSLWIIPCG